MEERLERMEGMLAAVIGMVGDIKKEQIEMKKDLVELKKAIQKENHQNETKNSLMSIEMDHEHTWQKTVQNEREISKLKKQFELIESHNV